MHVETAIKMIEDHGHKAFVTPEGLACLCEARPLSSLNAPDIAFADDDIWFEEVTTLPIEIFHHSIAIELHVEAVDVRNWLGY